MFSLDKAGHEGAVVQLGTSPFDKPTHWKQTIVQMPENVMEKDVGYEIVLNFERSNENERHYVIGMEVEVAEGCPEVADLLIKSAKMVAETDRLVRSNQVAHEAAEPLENSEDLVKDEEQKSAENAE